MRRLVFKWTAVNLMIICDRAQKLRAKTKFLLIWINPATRGGRTIADTSIMIL